MKARLAAGVIVATLPILIAAQAANVSGTWSLQADAAEGAFPNGGNWQVGAVSGTLTLEQKGNAVTGSWKGRQPEPWTLTGRIDGSTFELQTEDRQIPATRNGEQTTVSRHWIFSGTVHGDTLSGSMSLAGSEGEPTSQPFSAARKR
jgi:hypothetical protein